MYLSTTNKNIQTGLNLQFATGIIKTPPASPTTSTSDFFKSTIMDQECNNSNSLPQKLLVTGLINLSFVFMVRYLMNL